jgi:hypothetical protein
MTRALAVVAGAMAAMISAEARADPTRILVAVGNDRGSPGEQPLRYPAADAARFAQVMQTLGGVAPENTILLQDPDPAALEQGLARAQRLAARQAPDQVSLFFYFSGHGDREALHLGATAIGESELAARLNRIPARLRVVILDACRTMQPARRKGVSAEPGFAVSLRAPAGAVGTVWLHASSEGETAEESDELGGAVFTHYLLSGLRGAADDNGDQRVTLNEAYQFSYAHTLLRTLAGTAQRPTATIDVLETGPLVLTDMGGRSGAPLSWLQLPGERDVRYLVFARRSQTIAAELWSRPDRPSDVALAPGWYLVQRRPPDSRGGAAELHLAAGERRVVAVQDFVPVATEALADKGGELSLAPNEIELGAGALLGDGGGSGARLTGGYAREWGAWAVAAGLQAAATWRTTPANRVRERWLAGELRLERRWSGQGYRLRLGVGPAFQWLQQRATRRDAERVAEGGYRTEQRFHALAGGAVLLAGVRRELTNHLWVELSLRGGAVVARSPDGPVLRTDTGIGAAAGIAF